MARIFPRHFHFILSRRVTSADFSRNSGNVRPPVVPRRMSARQPVSVTGLAQGLPASAFQTIRWRQGMNETLSGRFAALRVRLAGGNIGKARLHPEQWLLIEWPAGDADPLKYDVSTLPDDIALNDLVAQAHMRWRIERDDQDLKREWGLGHYEGRGWRGFHPSRQPSAHSDTCQTQSPQSVTSSAFS